ncbi:hypothetical protein J3R82DRAFT_10579 [Butyriboletus roseoflavus]|nr:hypothetical protein J3R82DRAFT_10579 [Butyriboletus roseoflavus]
MLTKKTVTIKLTFLQEDVLLALLGIRHYVGFLLDTLAKVQAFLSLHTEKKHTLALVEDYDTAHKGDKANTQVRTVEDAKGATNPNSYDTMIGTLKEHLGDTTVAYVGLCYTFTVASILSSDEFCSLFSFHTKNFFTTSTPKAEQTKKQNDLNNQEAVYHHKLAQYSIPYFEYKTCELPCTDKYEATISNSPTCCYFIKEQLWEADHFMNSVIVGKDSQELPVKSIYNQLCAIGMQEFLVGRGIIVVVCHIEIHCVEVDPTPTKEQEDKEDKEDEEDDRLQHEFPEPEPSSNLTYMLGTTYTLLFMPNSTTGHFEFVTNPTPSQKEPLYLFINTWSSYFEGATGLGLDTTDHDEYFTALVQADPWWLVMQYSTGHPPYTGNAKDATPHHDTVYDQCCQPQALAFNYAHERCQGFDLNMNLSDQHRPNLSNKYRMAALMAVTHGLTSCQKLKMGEPGSSFCHIRHAVDFQIDHIHTTFFDQAAASCCDLVQFHEKVTVAGAVIGPFMVRMGERGISCTNQDDMNVLMGTKNESLKKKVYLQKYPKNEVLLTA